MNSAASNHKRAMKSQNQKMMKNCQKKKKEGKRCKLIKVTITSNEIILTSPVRSPNHYTDYKI